MYVQNHLIMGVVYLEQPELHDHVRGMGAEQRIRAGNITYALVEAPVTLAGTRHECQRRGFGRLAGKEAAPVTRPAGIPREVPLVCRRHVDLLRVSSAICPFCC